MRYGKYYTKFITKRGDRKRKKEGEEYSMEKMPMTKISGTVESVTFTNPDTNFTVLELSRDGDTNEMLCVVGEFPQVAEGERLTLHGYFTTHQTYGTQFKASAYERTLPKDVVSIERYLASGAIKGIGPVLARRMVEHFGKDTLTILEQQPARLSEVSGITPRKCQKITEELAQVFGIRLVMMFLAKLGVDSTTSISIWKKWGLNAQNVIRENPYVLCGDEISMNFEDVDYIGRKLDIPLDSSYRIHAAVLFLLRHNLYNGHTCLPDNKLIKFSQDLLEQNTIMVEKGIEQLVEEKEIIPMEVCGRIYYYLPEYLEAEQYIASKIEFMLMMQGESTTDYTDKINKLEEENGLEYASLQREAIGQALNSNIFILTGGPGTGKTTTINAILELFAQMEKKVVLCAPTGRAAKRMSEITGWEAKTIHRLLEVDFSARSLKFKRNEKNPLSSDVVIADEMSMVDVPLMRALISALKMGSRLILVGDSDQLPSVGPGNVLRDLINSERIPQVRLTEIFRQAQKSLIVTNAHAIVQGNMPILNSRDNDFFFLRRHQYEKMMDTVLELVSTRLPKSYGYSPTADIQVIAPTRVGPVGTTNLNRELQRVLNPQSPMKREMQFNGRILRVGDKIMQTRNNYDITWLRDDGEEGMGIFNGDIGIIEMIDKPTKTIRVRYDDRIADYLFEMTEQIELAYAITVHKSQGSEFEAVVMPLMHYNGKMHYRNLLYTAVTRAKNRLILLGEEHTIKYMVENNKKTIRYTNLLEALTGECCYEGI